MYNGTIANVTVLQQSVFEGGQNFVSCNTQNPSSRYPIEMQPGRETKSTIEQQK